MMGGPGGSTACGLWNAELILAAAMIWSRVLGIGALPVAAGLVVGVLLVAAVLAVDVLPAAVVPRGAAGGAGGKTKAAVAAELVVAVLQVAAVMGVAVLLEVVKMSCPSSIALVPQIDSMWGHAGGPHWKAAAPWFAVWSLPHRRLAGQAWSLQVFASLGGWAP